MWADEPAEGISSTFPEDSNYGLVNVDDVPYETFVSKVSDVNAGVVARHAKAERSGYLTLAMENERVIARNESDIRARGAVIAIGHELIQKRLVLEPGERKPIELPNDCRAVMVRQWDGSTSELDLPLPAGATGRQVIANTGDVAVQGAPYVVDASPPIAGVTGRLRPGESVEVPGDAGEARKVTSFELNGERVVFSCDGQSGRLFDRVVAEGLELGSVVFTVHDVIGGQHHWTRADTVESIETHTQARATVIDMIVSNKGGGPPTTAVDEAGRQEQLRSAPARFRIALRAVVFAEKPVALVRPLWVESMDDREWQLADVFVFCDPAIGGDGAGDVVGGGDVPSYYLGPSGVWTDPANGGAFGALSRPGEWQVSYFADPGGMKHADAYLAVWETIKPGASWKAPAGPYLWVYGTRLADGWRALALQCREAGAIR
jgi:hypothetical protein